MLVDPFLTGNPKAAAEADELEPTHDPPDARPRRPLGDTVEIAKRTGAQVVAIVELANELGGRGRRNVRDPNLGGTVDVRRGAG